MTQNRVPGVFVLGMHRSGTSAAVLSLESLGLNLCDETDRLRGGLGNSNPDHGESVTVITENDALLDLFGGSWLMPRLAPGWLSDNRVTSWQPAASAAFTAAHQTGPWACKDPRLCLTLPFWEQALATHVPRVIVIRHPLEIVKSLQSRESADDPHHPASYYLALWERYMRSSLIYSSHHPVFVLDYHQLVADPARATKALSHWLRRQGLRTTSPSHAAVDPSLHHCRVPQSLNGLTADQRRLHSLLTGLTGPHRDLGPLNLGRESPRTTALFGPGPQAADAGYIALPAAKSLHRRLAQINPLVTRRAAVAGLALTTLLAAASVALMQLTRVGRTADTDDWLTQQVLRLHLPTLDSLLRLASTVSARAYLDWAAVSATAALIVFRKRSAAAVLLLGLLASEAVNDLLRGPSHDPAGFFAGKAFRAALLFGLVAYLAFRLIESRLWRSVVAGLCLCMVMLVAVSRVYVHAHYPSAVLASLMLGAAVAVMLIAVFESIQKSPHRVPPKRSPGTTKLTHPIPLDDIS